MADERKDGGPAFPSQPLCEMPNGTFIAHDQGGMTLREWYAGQALANPAICTGADHDYNLRGWFGDRGGITRWEIAAMQAHQYADAMLTARQKDGGQQ